MFCRSVATLSSHNRTKRMAWLGKVTLGNLSDFAGAVTKLSESVKNIEKNFDSALGFDNKGGVQEAHQLGSKKGTGIESTGSPIFHKDAFRETSSHVDESTSSSLDFEETGKESSGSVAASVGGAQDFHADFENVMSANQKNDERTVSSESQSNQPVAAKEATETAEAVQAKEPKEHHDWEELQSRTGVGLDDQFVLQEVSLGDSSRKSEEIPESGEVIQLQLRKDQSLDKHGTETLEDDAFVTVESMTVEPYESQPDEVEHKEVVKSFMTTDVLQQQQKDAPQTVSAEGNLSIINTAPAATEHEEAAEINDQNFDHPSSLAFSEEKLFFDRGQDESVEKLKLEMQMMEAALKGAAKQAQTKADEISRLLLENDQLKSTIEDLKVCSFTPWFCNCLIF
ncbi:hypothetical protein O6H91_Y308500 [Diphasiastrum complanatum]|nr:hypothetical protein O6H91_Y308500 [Diphasiastrum complanatum]